MCCPCMWGAVLQVWHPDKPLPVHLDSRLALARSLTDDERDLAAQRIVIAYYLYNAHRRCSAQAL
eukprot:6614969-Pyramimonas_sp.AAC.1